MVEDVKEIENHTDG